MSRRQESVDVFTDRLKSWRHLTLGASAFLIVAATLVVWVSGNRRTPSLGDREPGRGLEGVLTADPANPREPRSPPEKDRAGIRRPRAPRTVSEQQARMVAEVLRGFPLDQRPLAEPISVLSLVGDREAAQYAKQLAEVVEQAGWATTLSTTAVQYNGVMCLVDNATEFPVHARALTFAFERAGIACQAANKDARPSNRIEIVVGYDRID